MKRDPYEITISELVAALPSRLAELAKTEKRPEGKDGEGYEFRIVLESFRAKRPECDPSQFDAAWMLAGLAWISRGEKGDPIILALLQGYREWYQTAWAREDERIRRPTKGRSAGDILAESLLTGRKWE